MPRDEILPWLEEEDSDEEEDDGELIELADLYGDTLIDAGVTSGADPSGWDPIDVDRRGRQDEGEDVVDTSKLGADQSAGEGVTSGNDLGTFDVGKSKERKPE